MHDRTSFMSSLEFHLLDIEDKAEFVFSKGVFVETVEYFNQKVVLYSLFSFWVEVFYNPEDNIIETIHLAGPEEMKKYLKKINLT